MLAFTSPNAKPTEHQKNRVSNHASPVELLTEEQKAEVLEFLNERPLHTVHLAGLILDNGVVSPLNRGSFFGYRDETGELAGVALIGHATIFEARSPTALEAFASLAQESSRTHMLLGETDKIESFWGYYANGGQSPRLICRELLFELRFPVLVKHPVPGLRRATLRDLDLVMPVQAAMAESESGTNPLEADPHGFRVRCARRIEQGRVWVLFENGELLFKADIAYLEGIYVDPKSRGGGLGLRCLSQLTRLLLSRTRAVSLLVNQQNEEGVAFYLKAGFKLRSHYDIIFLNKAAS
jgi:GNAT superfamily N-acetyltransferase